MARSRKTQTPPEPPAPARTKALPELEPAAPGHVSATYAEHRDRLRTGDVVLFGDADGWIGCALIVIDEAHDQVLLWRLRADESQPRVHDAGRYLGGWEGEAIAVRRLIHPQFGAHAGGALAKVRRAEYESGADLMLAAWYALGLLSPADLPEDPPTSPAAADYAAGAPPLPWVKGCGLGREIYLRGDPPKGQ